MWSSIRRPQQTGDESQTPEVSEHPEDLARESDWEPTPDEGGRLSLGHWSLAFELFPCLPRRTGVRYHYATNADLQQGIG